MKVIFRDMKTGEMKLLVETKEDLWHLEKILEPGDLVSGKTTRKTAIKSGTEIREGDRRPMTLEIDLEKVEFSGQTHSLRLTGKITKGPEDVQLHSYHTLSVQPHSKIAIVKEKWKPYHLDRIEKAKYKAPLIFICVLDREQADFGMLTDAGLELRGSVKHSKVLGSDDRTEYYEKIIETLKKNSELDIILAGPGFERENLFEYIKKKRVGFLDKIFLEHAHSTGKPGMNEVIRNSAVKVMKQSRISKETELVERLLEEINKDGKVVYGKRETLEAVKAGAIETLLVSEGVVKQSEETMNLAEKIKSKIVIISTDHESGEKFLSLGGIGGFLRYKI